MPSASPTASGSEVSCAEPGCFGITVSAFMVMLRADPHPALQVRPVRRNATSLTPESDHSLERRTRATFQGSCDSSP